MAYEIQRLLPRHFRMLDLKVAGYNNTQIAKLLDVSVVGVTTVCRSPLFTAELNRRMKDRNENAPAEERDAFLGKARSILSENAPKAATVAVDLMDSDDDSVRLRASGSILDRVLGKPDTKTDVQSSAPTVVINSEVANLLVLALKEVNPNASEKPVPNGETTDRSENQQGDVCETVPTCAWIGHRETETQNRPKEVIGSDGSGGTS